MKTYKLKLQVYSALQTPLQPDTLFGHLCWSIRYTEGQQALQAFLDSFMQGSPPVVLGSAFPEGFWPAPLLPGPSRQQEDILLDMLSKISRTELKNRLPFCPLSENSVSETLTDLEAFDILKWLRKLRFLPEEMLPEFAAAMDSFAILQRFLQNGCGKANLLTSAAVAHNSVNRLTGASDELYFSNEYFPNPKKPPVFQLVVMSDIWDAHQITEKFTAALQGGYGKSKSRGKGWIKVIGTEPFTLPHAQSPNALLLLGTCCPAQTDPAQGFWQCATKAGKLGGDWAVGDNPFKKPLTMLLPGSLLKTDSPKSYCGRLVKGVSDAYPQVVQYGLAPVLAVRWDAKEVL